MSLSRIPWRRTCRTTLSLKEFSRPQLHFTVIPHSSAVPVMRAAKALILSSECWDIFHIFIVWMALWTLSTDNFSMEAMNRAGVVRVE